MLEKDIENLIAKYPDDIFPGEGFKLVGQQYDVEGRRVDILFQDRLKRNIIVEVKRGILSREASGQVAEYYGLLKSSKPAEFHELVLCANVIPKERRTFLEHIGIECKELGIAFISELARKHSYTFLDDSPSYRISAPTKLTAWKETTRATEDDEISVWLFQANPNRYDVLNALSDTEIGNDIHWLVNQYRNKIRKGHLGLIWMSGADAGIYALTKIETDPALMQEFPSEKKYWLNEEKGEAVRVRMTVIRRLTNKPILKSQLVTISALKNLSILNRFQGTNFPVRSIEWECLSRLL